MHVSWYTGEGLIVSDSHLTEDQILGIYELGYKDRESRGFDPMFHESICDIIDSLNPVFPPIGAMSNLHGDEIKVVAHGAEKSIWYDDGCRVFMLRFDDAQNMIWEVGDVDI